MDGGFVRPLCLGSWAVPFLLHTLLFPSLWYKLILVSSVHRMLFQNCEGKELLMILSIPPHQWSMVVVVSWRGHVWLPVELVLLYLLMMWLLTKAAGWILKCFGQYYLLIFSQMLQNSLDGASQCRWTMTQSILQKQPKSFWRERSGLLCNGQVNHLTWIRLSMHFTCWDKTEGKMPQEQAGTEDGCSRGLAEHHQGWNPASVMSMRSRLQAVIDCKGFATKY